MRLHKVSSICLLLCMLGFIADGKKSKVIRDCYKSSKMACEIYDSIPAIRDCFELKMRICIGINLRNRKYMEASCLTKIERKEDIICYGNTCIPVFYDIPRTVCG